MVLIFCHFFFRNPYISWCRCRIPIPSSPRAPPHTFGCSRMHARDFLKRWIRISLVMPWGSDFHDGPTLVFPWDRLSSWICTHPLVHLMHSVDKRLEPPPFILSTGYTLSSEYRLTRLNAAFASVVTFFRLRINRISRDAIVRSSRSIKEVCKFSRPQAVVSLTPVVSFVPCGNRVLS